MVQSDNEKPLNIARRSDFYASCVALKCSL